MKKSLFILGVIVVLFSSCMSVKDITVNGIPGLYREDENKEGKMTAYIRYEIVDIDHFFADSFTIWLEKTITNDTFVYSITLYIFRTGTHLTILEEFIMEIDGTFYTLRDPDPYRYLYPRPSGVITDSLEEGIQSTIDEDIVKRIANAKSPIIFKYGTSDPIVIEGEQLQKVKQFADGLLTVQSAADLGM